MACRLCKTEDMDEVAYAMPARGLQAMGRVSHWPITRTTRQSPFSAHISSSAIAASHNPYPV